MTKTRNGLLATALLALTLAMALVLPAPALAATSDYRVTEYATAPGATKAVSDIGIGDVYAPKAVEALDDNAVVTTAEDETWEIPVLWLDPSLQLATQAAEGTTYLPVLVFYFPADIMPAQTDDAGAFMVSFSPDLVELFDGQEIISIFNENLGITYILPASLRAFFAPAAAPAVVGNPVPASTTETAPATTATPSAPTTATTPSELARLVDLYCSQSAKDNLSQEDLEYLVDLILYKLQPQAVNLLRAKFPAFDQAASSGELGTRIGFYIYYETGDQDGIPEHENASSDALAYVFGQPLVGNDGASFFYTLNVNAEEASIINGSSATVAREGKVLSTLENTLVHEMLHAFMQDYNRTGMIGATSSNEIVRDINNPSKDELNRYLSTRYPLWFIEGTASSVENVYQYRHFSFETLRAAVPAAGYAEGSDEAVFYNFLTATYEGKPFGFLLSYAAGTYADANGEPINTTTSRYVSGYLATLYLSEMAASASDIGSSITTVDGKTTVSSENLRMGLNSIIERLHKGETLDQVINDISKGAYASTDDFESKFIVGPTVAVGDQQSYAGDDPSIAFVAKFLNYMDSIDKDESRSYGANGSILFDFDRDYEGPLDPTVVSSTDIYEIVENNTLVESTVPNSNALAAGGKSRSASNVSSLSSAADGTDAAPEFELAAKATNDVTSPAEETAGEDDASSMSDVPEPTEAALPVASEASSVPEPCAEPVIETSAATEEPAVEAEPTDETAITDPIASTDVES